MRSLVAFPFAMVGAALLVAPLAANAADADGGIYANSNEMKWGDAPPTLPKGAKITVLSGDPSKSGPFVIRLLSPPNYKVAPHWHTQAENLTIVSGTLYLGEGDAMSTAHVHALKPGGFHYLPAKQHHYAFTKGGSTIIQIHGEGPFDINYIDAKDDPQKVAKRS